MTNGAQLRGIFVGLLMIICGAAVILFDGAEQWIPIVLGCMLCWRGISTLFSYFSVLRRTVASERVMWIGIIIFDLGVLALVTYDRPTFVIVTYLVVTHVVEGGINFARGILSRADDPRWRESVLMGLLRLCIAISCIVFMHDYAMLDIIWGLGFMVEGIMRIASSLRPTAVLFVP